MSYCNKCGNKLNEDVKFCPSCGSPVVSSVTSAPSVPSTPMSPQQVSRPGGITLLSVLQGFASFVSLLGGMALMGLSLLIAVGGVIPEEELAQALQEMPWSQHLSMPECRQTSLRRSRM